VDDGLTPLSRVIVASSLKYNTSPSISSLDIVISSAIRISLDERNEGLEGFHEPLSYTKSTGFI